MSDQELLEAYRKANDNKNPSNVNHLLNFAKQNNYNFGYGKIKQIYNSIKNTNKNENENKEKEIIKNQDRNLDVNKDENIKNTKLKANPSTKEVSLIEYTNDENKQEIKTWSYDINKALNIINEYIKNENKNKDVTENELINVKEWAKINKNIELSKEELLQGFAQLKSYNELDLPKTNKIIKKDDKKDNKKGILYILTIVLHEELYFIKILLSNTIVSRSILY